MTMTKFANFKNTLLIRNDAEIVHIEFCFKMNIEQGWVIKGHNSTEMDNTTC